MHIDDKDQCSSYGSDTMIESWLDDLVTGADIEVVYVCTLEV